MVRWPWVNFECVFSKPVQGRPTIRMIVGQGPVALAVGAVEVVWTFFLSSVVSLLSQGDGRKHTEKLSQRAVESKTTNQSRNRSDYR